MNKLKKVLSTGIILTGLTVGLTACQTDAQKVNDNLSQEADQFKVQRRIIFYNGITDKYIMTVEGLCSINRDNGQLVVTCKTGPSTYIKDFLGLSDNVTYFVQQSEENATGASKYHHKVVLKPENIIPDFDLELGEN